MNEDDCEKKIGGDINKHNLTNYMYQTPITAPQYCRNA